MWFLPRKKLVSDWILSSCRTHRVTWGQIEKEDQNTHDLPPMLQFLTSRCWSVERGPEKWRHQRLWVWMRVSTRPRDQTWWFASCSWRRHSCLAGLKQLVLESLLPCLPMCFVSCCSERSKGIQQLYMPNVTKNGLNWFWGKWWVVSAQWFRWLYRWEEYYPISCTGYLPHKG